LVAALLEVMRALAAGPAHRNDEIALFDNAGREAASPGRGHSSGSIQVENQGSAADG
jgi:hypothetical protein